MMSQLLGPDRETFWAIVSLGIFLFLFVVISIRLFFTSREKLDEAARLPFSNHEEGLKP